MGGASLAWRLREALRREEPRAVQELLCRGADPNLVLEDGVAAVHLAAGGRRPRALLCLGALLQRGADPNVRSAEALTPVHVAAAWGCGGGLELLLRGGGDPALRDQDGLQPLDWALRQGHLDCAQVLRELATPTRTQEEPTRLQVSVDYSTQSADAAGGDQEWGAPRGPSSRPAGPGGCGSPVGSDESFVTALEAAADSGSDPDSLCDPTALPQPLGAPSPPGAAGGEALLSGRLHALALDSPPSTPAWCPPGGPDGVELHRGEDGVPGDGARAPCVPTMSDVELLRALRALGHQPGPVTRFTRPHYVQRLQRAQAGPAAGVGGHSPELEAALRTGHIPDSQVDEAALAAHFATPKPGERWREGHTKSSFTYLLLDPRETQDLPARASSLTLAECLQTFVRAIFYVGKGTRARPDAHLWEALGCRGRPDTQACPKLRQILDIWASGHGVISLHCFQHVVAAEAYTREACLLEALGIQTLTNQKQGHYYGVVASWPPERRRRLGVHLLQRALLIFLAEGERELRPQDLQARGRAPRTPVKLNSCATVPGAQGGPAMP